MMMMMMILLLLLLDDNDNNTDDNDDDDDHDDDDNNNCLQPVGQSAQMTSKPIGRLSRAASHVPRDSKGQLSY